ncbi:MAG: response regulator [Candidatus Lokiarchaeota archaeon]|nr:response regulator [Candidatus Lokiarchaeota archaeon]
MLDVCVIEDDDELRKYYVDSINRMDGFEIVGDYADCESAIKNIDSDLPDFVLMDIQLPGMSGIEGVRKIKEILPDVHIIMLTIHADNESVFGSLRAGASGYLVKNVDADQLLSAIDEILLGGAPMSMTIARMVISFFREKPQKNPLTARQLEILKKLCEGKSYKMIADELYISIATVKFHIRKIYDKLQAESKADAIRIAMQRKLFQ